MNELSLANHGTGVICLAVEPDARKNEVSDLELIAAINGGDSEAFEQLYWRYRGWVSQLALRWTGDPDLACDVLQETFLYLLKKFPGFVLTCQLKTFLYPAVRNLSISARQKRDRHAEPGDLLDSLEAPPVAPAESGSGNLSGALAALPPGQREVLLLRFVDGLDLAEIGEALEIPLGTVKSRLHHALNTLRSDPRTRSYFE